MSISLGKSMGKLSRGKETTSSYKAYKAYSGESRVLVNSDETLQVMLEYGYDYFIPKGHWSMEYIQRFMDFHEMAEEDRIQLQAMYTSLVVMMAKYPDAASLPYKEVVRHCEERVKLMWFTWYKV